jgi:hypothetical protein
MNKGTQSAIFLKQFPWPFIWNIWIYFFVNSIGFKFYTLTRVIFWYKIQNKKSILNDSYVVLNGSKKFGV